jgi:hypothetical protein
MLNSKSDGMRGILFTASNLLYFRIDLLSRCLFFCRLNKERENHTESESDGKGILFFNLNIIVQNLPTFIALSCFIYIPNVNEKVKNIQALN